MIDVMIDETLAARSSARGRLPVVMRAIEELIVAAIAVLILLAVAGPAPAHADFVDEESQELASARHYKRRLAAALSLSKFHDGRAVRSLARALERDDDSKLRQVAALALAKAMTEATPQADRELAFAALQRATVADGDARVRELAARTLRKLEGLRLVAAALPPPAIFIYVPGATDASAKAPTDALDRLTTLVRGAVTRRAPELPTAWPGALPTARDLGTHGTKAYAVATNIASVDIVQRGGQVEITCKVQVRVTPWNGVDGAERWVAHKAASASGQGRASTAATARAIAGGIRDCVMAVAEEVTANQVVPFLRKIIAAS